MGGGGGGAGGYLDFSTPDKVAETIKTPYE